MRQWCLQEKHAHSPARGSMINTHAASQVALTRMNGTRKISASNLGRLSSSSGSRAGRPRRALSLLLFLVIGMLLLSSTTLLMQQPSSSISATEPSVRLLGLHGTAASNASLPLDPGVLPQPATAGRHRRWRLKGPSSMDQLPHQHTPQQPAGQPSSPAAAAAAAAAAPGIKALPQPTSLLPELSKPHGQLSAPAAAQQELMPAAQPEDVSLILASGQDDERQQPEQQKQLLGPAAGSPASLQPGVDPQDATSAYIKKRGVAPVRLTYPLWWHGPIWSGSGYGSEAVNYVLALLRSGRLAPADIWAYHHGDGFREQVVKSMSPDDRRELEYLQSLPAKYRATRAAVVVCHSVPVNWAFPEAMYTTGALCPPNPKEFPWVYSVGRTMFETDRLPAQFVPRLNAMNEIWVPSEWQRQTFIDSGVDATKLFVVPEGVNTSLYDPALYTPMSFRDRAELVFGRHWEAKLGEQAAAALAAGGTATRAVPQLGVDPTAGGAAPAGTGGVSGVGTGPAAAAAPADDSQPQLGRLLQGQQHQRQQKTASSASAKKKIGGGSSGGGRQPFRFISTFKWEQRKGWDLLLEAYLTAFTADDDVELYILTQPFGSSGSSFRDKMHSWANKLNITYTHSTTTSSQGQQGQGRSLQGSAAQGQQQQQHQEEGSWSGNSSGSAWEPLGDDDDGSERPVTDQAAWSEHVESVVQQIQEFATQLEARRRLQAEAVPNVPTPAAAAAAAAPSAGEGGLQDLSGQGDLQGSIAAAPQQQQRQLLQASSAKAAGLTTQQAPSAFTATAPETPQQAQQRLAADAAAQRAARYPTLYVITGHISDADFPRFYKSGDAFVLPTRGEGWGRPHVEAMSMGLPVLSTNWSGPTAYLDESVGYPIAIDGLVPVKGGAETIWWFRGLKWAQPSLQHLVQLMRRVHSNREEAAAKGAAARARMIERYGPDAIADVLVRHMQRIQDRVP